MEHYDLFWEEFFLHSHIVHSTAYEEVRLLPPRSRLICCGVELVGCGHEQDSGGRARVVQRM